MKQIPKYPEFVILPIKIFPLYPFFMITLPVIFSLTGNKVVFMPLMFLIKFQMFSCIRVKQKNYPFQSL